MLGLLNQHLWGQGSENLHLILTRSLGISSALYTRATYIQSCSLSKRVVASRETLLLDSGGVQMSAQSWPQSYYGEGFLNMSSVLDVGMRDPPLESLLCVLCNWLTWYNFPNSPEEGLIFTAPVFCTGASWGSERLGNLPRTTQLVIKELNLNLMEAWSPSCQPVSVLDCQVWMGPSEPVGTGWGGGGR